MSATPLAHKKSVLGRLGGQPEPLKVCDSDCPACAAQRDIDNAVRIIVLEMWVEAVASGERTVEAALREVLAPIKLLHEFERNKVGWSFTRRALAAKPAKTRSRKPRGLPTAWVKANYEIVNSVSHFESLPKNNIDAVEDFGLASVFPRVAEIWNQYGIMVTALQVKQSFYRVGPNSR